MAVAYTLLHVRAHGCMELEKMSGGRGEGGIVRTVASSLEVVRPYWVVITTTPTFAHSLVQVPHKINVVRPWPYLPYRLLRA